MATTKDYVEFVCEQLKGNFDVCYKKMFGEYMVYVNSKPILLVCDNNVFVKKIKELDEIMCNSECGFPYDGAKEYYILDIENTDLTNEVVLNLERAYVCKKTKKV